MDDHSTIAASQADRAKACGRGASAPVEDCCTPVSRAAGAKETDGRSVGFETMLLGAFLQCSCSSPSPARIPSVWKKVSSNRNAAEQVIALNRIHWPNWRACCGLKS